MDTSVRNRVLATAVIKLGVAHVAKSLCLTQTELIQYAEGDLPVPDSLWAHIVQADSGLIYGSHLLGSKPRPSEDPNLSWDELTEETPPGYAHSHRGGRTP